jgi:putative solute:sodium symporter small subunit
MTAPHPPSFDPAAANAHAAAAAAPANVASAQARRRYWHFNLSVIAVLLVLGGAISFVAPLYAPELAALHWRGWSLPYYLGAQGATLSYVLLIVVYIVLMQWAERRLKARLGTIAVLDAAHRAAARVLTSPGPGR